MFHHWVTSMTIGVAVFLWVAGTGTSGWAQHGGHGGHGGHGSYGGHHSGFGHSGFGHSGFGHSGFGHYGGAGHYGGFGHYGDFGHHAGYGHYGGLGYHADIGIHGGLRDHGYGHYGYGHYGYTNYDSPTYFSLYSGPWYGYSGYAYDDGWPRYQVAYGSDSEVPYVSATLAQGCASRSSCGGSGPVAPPPSSVRNSRSAAVPPSAQRESDYQRLAKDAFRAGRYDQALRLGNHALVEAPRDGKLYLFVSQALFATGDYQGAATAIHRGASLLEPKDWGYVVENFRKYYRGKDYVEQMDRLTKFIEANPDAVSARFLRGYHHAYLGHRETARRELAKAVELEGRDKLAARLLEMFGAQTPSDPDGPDAGDIPIGPGDDAGTPENAEQEPHHDEHKDHQH